MVINMKSKSYYKLLYQTDIENLYQCCFNYFKAQLDPLDLEALLVQLALKVPPDPLVLLDPLDREEALVQLASKEPRDQTDCLDRLVQRGQQVEYCYLYVLTYYF